MKIGYERGLLFRGIFPRESEEILKEFEFYKGKCNKYYIGSHPKGERNLFNFLDYWCCSTAVEQDFKPI